MPSFAERPSTLGRMGWHPSYGSLALAAILALVVRALAAAEPLEVFRDCDVCPEMITVPTGTFMMGSTPGEVRRGWMLENWQYSYRKDSKWYSSRSELPRHEVKVLDLFSISRHEITYNQWMSCVADGGCNGYVPDDHMGGANSHWIGGSHPVVRISYQDASAYVSWLNMRTGSADSYSLPTEAEWEYAARAGSTSRFAQGDQLTSYQANFSGQATELVTLKEWPKLKTRHKPVPVQELMAENRWGIRHMAGNVREITSSCYSKAYYSWKSTRRWVKESKKKCTHIVTRGGSFQSPMENLRSAWRSHQPVTKRLRAVGFRVIKRKNNSP